MKYAEEQGFGRGTVNYRLRDWLISRQRMWGAPIPIIYCETHGAVPVPESDLPVLLPDDAEFRPTGESPLTYHEGFLHTTCPICGEPARRETDTMDTFMCSSWYQMRYIDPHNDERPFSRELAKKWLPVDQYTGGAEHAVMHLLYTRFFTKAARDMGVVEIDEPMVRLFNQGQILGPDGQRMSKSRGNVIAPDGEVEKWGADTFRAYLMFLGPWDGGGPYDASGINGTARWLNRVWNAVTGETRTGAHADAPETRELRRWTHKTIAKVTEDIADFHFNTMLAALMEFTNHLTRLRESGAEVDAEAWREAQGVAGADAGAERAAHRRGAVGAAGQAVQRPHAGVAAVRRGAGGGRRRRDRRAGEREGARAPDAPRRRAGGRRPRPRDGERVAWRRTSRGKEIVRVIYVPNRLLNIVVKGGDPNQRILAALWGSRRVHDGRASGAGAIGRMMFVSGRRPGGLDEPLPCCRPPACSHRGGAVRLTCLFCASRRHRFLSVPSLGVTSSPWRSVSARRILVDRCVHRRVQRVERTDRQET